MVLALRAIKAEHPRRDPGSTAALKDQCKNQTHISEAKINGFDLLIENVTFSSLSAAVISLTMGGEMCVGRR